MQEKRCTNAFVRVNAPQYLGDMNTAKMTDDLIAHGLKQHQIADYCGVSQSTVSRWRTGKDPEGPSRDKLRDLYERTMSAAGSAPLPNPSLVRIPDLAIFGGMGNGGLVEYREDDYGNPTDPDQVRGYWSLPDYMVRAFGDLKNVYAWEVRGDSMSPTLEGGSVVFVDTVQNSPPPDDIYAINYGDGLMVKRLKLVPRSDRVQIISDNERYGVDELLREEVQVFGRIVGWFQWRG